jgi:hypothetical protein
MSQYVRLGSFSSATALSLDVCFAPESCRGCHRSRRQLRAITRHPFERELELGQSAPGHCPSSRILCSAYFVAVRIPLSPAGGCQSGTLKTKLPPRGLVSAPTACRNSGSKSTSSRLRLTVAGRLTWRRANVSRCLSGCDASSAAVGA